ncbi:MAG TPA: PIN domain-containing protein [Chitinophagaceae bacterium]|jgi:predicted nucleic acid-binding protein
MKIFIDTNIFLDALLKREPFKIHAENLLNLCDERVFTAYTSCVSFTNLTYFLQRYNKSDHVETLERILNTITIIPLENKDFKKALSLNFSDVEDAYQYTAALKERGMKFIITRNTNDFKKSTIPVISAKDFLLKET